MANLWEDDDQGNLGDLPAFQWWGKRLAKGAVGNKITDKWNEDPGSYYGSNDSYRYPGPIWDQEDAGKRWDQTSKRIPPIFGYPQPAIEGLEAVTGILEDPYSGIGAEGEQRVAEGSKLAFERAGTAARRVKGGPDKGPQGPFDRGRRDRDREGREPRMEGRGRELPDVDSALAKFSPSIASSLAGIENDRERAYTLWKMMQGDQRLRQFLMPYLSAYNQQYGTLRSYEERLKQMEAMNPEGNALNDWLNVIGTGVNIAGIVTCWVAREVFGEDDPRWLQARFYVRNIAPGWFRRFYLKHGPSWAEFLKRHAWLKPLHRPLFEYMAARGRDAMDLGRVTA